MYYVCSGNQSCVSTPYNIFHRWTVDLRNHLLLLYVVQDNCSRRAENETCSTTIEIFICLDWWFDGLDNGIGEVVDFDKLFHCVRATSDKQEQTKGWGKTSDIYKCN
jgi:hypothetical protein